MGAPATHRGRGRREDRRCPLRAKRRPCDPPQRIASKDAVDQGRRPGGGDPEAAGRLVLPVPLGAPPAHRPGPLRGGHGGLRQRRLDPVGRRPGGGHGGRGRHLQVRGLPHLCRARRAGGSLPQPDPRTCGLPLRLPGRHLRGRPGRRPRPGRLPSGRGCHRDQRRGRPGGPRGRHRRQRGRDVLDPVPALLEGPGAHRGPPRHLRRPRRPEGR